MCDGEVGIGGDRCWRGHIAVFRETNLSVAAEALVCRGLEGLPIRSGFLNHQAIV